ncbi:DUF945 domain-containing protein [Pseudoalteromonas aurantia]|uniref:DUF945 domain-containing protein n=2 Tax=Pseudoalteromonas TaxID=53246 RepID=A0A5S3VCE5_9GAMM|nr:DUF945 domain-containing protein [Pseudoalteromonas aurantia]TMO60084.1 hypothetical protein CWC18_14595 [Pseudoalteromonas aurantia]TMO69772.1 hypothetical protein CWC19_03700 [Pseudoalteromonas aurantia]TMO77949.1 hypothetical protein CWC20_02965 [Pseudoalteromonas aurantia]
MKKSVIILLASGALAAGYVAMQSHVNQLVDDKLQTQFALAAGDSGLQFDYADASANVFNGNIVVNGLTVADPEGVAAFSIDEIVLIGYEEDKISEFTQINVQGFTLSDAIKADNIDAPKALLDAHYNFGTSLAYDAQTGYSRLKMDLVAQGLTGLNLDMELSNSTPLMEVSFEMQKAQDASTLTVEEQLQMQTKIMEAMQQLAPKSLKLNVENKGQLAQLLDEQLAVAGLDQASFENMLQIQLAQAPLPQAAKEGVMAFAQGKELLSLSVSLPENMDIESLSQQAMMLAGQPEALAKLLNLEVQGK